MFRFNRKGQSTLEYVLLITSVVAALLLVQHYLSRGIQGRVRDAADNLGGQFDAQATTSNFNITRTSTVRETNVGGITRSDLVVPEVTTRTGSETVAVPSSGLR